MTKLKNIKDLRDDLLSNYNQTKSGEMGVPMAKELANTAGKVLSSIKLELEYNKYMGINRKIEFLNFEEEDK